MDGLLLDTERLAKQTFLAACVEYGWKPDLAGYDQCIGTTYEDTERILRQAYGPAFPFAEIRARWGELYEQWVLQRPVPLRPGAAELLERFAELEIPCALATSTRRELARAKLHHAGLESCFSYLVCAGEAPRGKPHPEPYLWAAAGIGEAPAACWALEDSNSGVRAAHAAGLRVFQVPDQVAPSADIKALGHSIVGSLFEVLHHL
jgi:HAD superfamily hydrolase (TIGR01509 family)